MGDPYFQNQIPAPDANVAADTPLYAEIVDDDNDLDPTTVELYVDGTLAFHGPNVMPGFGGSRVAVTNGYGYTFTSANPFEPGSHTIRGVAEDTGGNPMNESYSFSTRPVLVTEEDVEAAAAAEAGFDLYLDTGHDVVVEDYDLVLVAGADEVAQHLVVGLKLFYGEWYLDETAGMTYYRDVFVEAPNSRVIEALFRQAVLSDEDIEQLREFDLEIDRATRKLDVSFAAVSSVGEVAVGEVFP